MIGSTRDCLLVDQQHVVRAGLVVEADARDLDLDLVGRNVSPMPDEPDGERPHEQAATTAASEQQAERDARLQPSCSDLTRVVRLLRKRASAAELARDHVQLRRSRTARLGARHLDLCEMRA